MRDIDVIVSSTNVTSLSGGKSEPTATGHFTVSYVDASTGQVYTSLGFSAGLFKLTALDIGAKPDLFGLALHRPDGTLFHAMGALDRNGNAQPATVVAGSIVSNL